MQYPAVHDPVYWVLFVAAAMWGLVLVAALVGWGVIVKRVLFPAARADLGLLAAWGMAAIIAVGGVLNLAWLISARAILIIVALGLAALAAGWKGVTPPRLPGGYAVTRGICWVLLGVLGICYLGCISSGYFSPQDDLTAYLVFPQKMLQTGSLGPDPYCQRRLLSALGGQSFLDCFYQAVLPFQFAYLIDPGVGLLVTVLLLLGMSRRRWGLGTVAMLVLLVLDVPLQKNITSYYTGVALLLGLARTVGWGPQRRGGALAGGAIVGLLLSGAVCLKTTLVPSVGSAAIVIYALLLIRGGMRRALGEGTTAAMVCVVLLVPWMLSMKASSGTYFYPLLGQGYHGSRYGTFEVPMRTLSGNAVAQLVVWSMISPGATAILYLLLVGRRRTWREPMRDGAVALGVSGLVGGAAVTVATAGCEILRFLWAIQFPAVIMVMWSVLRVRPARFWRVAVVALLIGWMTADYAGAVGRYYLHAAENLRLAARAGRVFDAKQGAVYRAAQGAVPPGVPILARLDQPMHLDFRRNQVFLVDFAGTCSPPPGLPYRQGSEAVARYLLGQGLRYVMYSYANQAMFDRKSQEYKLVPGYWIEQRQETEHTLEFQENLDLLGRSRRRVYDDGNIFVLDLDTRRGGGNASAGSR